MNVAVGRWRAGLGSRAAARRWVVALLAGGRIPALGGSRFSMNHRRAQGRALDGAGCSTGPAFGTVPSRQCAL